MREKVPEPTGRANARPVTGSARAEEGCHKETRRPLCRLAFASLMAGAAHRRFYWRTAAWIDAEYHALVGSRRKMTVLRDKLKSW